MIPKRFIASYCNSGRWDWTDYSRNEFHTVRDYLEYQLEYKLRYVDQIGSMDLDVKYLPLLKNTNRNEYWDIDDNIYTLRYVNGITGEIRFEMGFDFNGKENVLKQNDSIPDFWQDIYKQGFSFKSAAQPYEILVYAALVAEYPELKEEFELIIGDFHVGLHSKTTGYNFDRISSLKMLPKENGKIDILGVQRTESGERKHISILELARLHKQNGMLESAIEETEQQTRMEEIEKGDKKIKLLQLEKGRDLDTEK